MRHAVEYATGWMPMPSQQKFSERLAELAAIADEAGQPVPSVTLHAVRAGRRRAGPLRVARASSGPF